MELPLISFEDLMKECNIEDAAEFRRLLKRNGLPSVSLRKPIERNVANRIVKRITGHKIDWFKYKLQKRDLVDEGPLKQKSTDFVKQLVDKWYHKVAPDRDLRSNKGCVLGVVCFLKGKLDAEFTLKMDPNLNILIGDRGSGKSTALNLVGLLTDSVIEGSEVLVDNLRNLYDEKQDNPTVNFSRRIRSGLFGYGVHTYACFFIKEGTTLCYYVSLDEGSFDFLEYREGGWESTDKIDSAAGSLMLVLQAVQETRNPRR